MGSDAVQQHVVTSEAVDDELQQRERAQGAVLSGVAGDIGAGVSTCASLCTPWLTQRRPHEPFTFTVCRAGFGCAASTAADAAARRRRIICLLLCVPERQKRRRQGRHDGEEGQVEKVNGKSAIFVLLPPSSVYDLQGLTAACDFFMRWRRAARCCGVTTVQLLIASATSKNSVTPLSPPSVLTALALS